MSEQVCLFGAKHIIDTTFKMHGSMRFTVCFRHAPGALPQVAAIMCVCIEIEIEIDTDTDTEIEIDGTLPARCRSRRC